MTEKTPNNLIRIKTVVEKTQLSQSYVYKLSAAGLFPRSVDLVPGGHSKAWVESEVQDWIDQRITDRDGDINNEQ